MNSSQDVRAGAFQLMVAARPFGAGLHRGGRGRSGVGSSRRILWARSAERQYLAPDNGLLDWVAGSDPFWRFGGLLPGALAR